MLRSTGTTLAIFWAWWLRELRGLLKWRAVAPAPGYKAYRELLLTGDGLDIADVERHGNRETRTPLGSLPLPLPVGDGARYLLKFKANRPLVLAVPADRCFLHSLAVPKAALARIDQFLALELSRLTPFTATDVLTGWYETAEVADETHSTVSQVVVARSLLTPTLETLARAKLPLAGIFAKTEGGYLPARLANATLAVGDQALPRWRKFAAAGLAFAIVGGLAALFALFDRQAAQLDDLDGRIEIAQKKALDVRKRLAVMESSSQRIVELKQAKLSAPSLLAVWEELTRLVPDTAWVSTLSIDRMQVTIEGNARVPEELITLLDASPLFEAVSFNAPVTKLPGNDMTRFVIRLSLSKPLEVSSAAP